MFLCVVFSSCLFSAGFGLLCVFCGIADLSYG